MVFESDVDLFCYGYSYSPTSNNRRIHAGIIMVAPQSTTSHTGRLSVPPALLPLCLASFLLLQCTAGSVAESSQDSQRNTGQEDHMAASEASEVARK
jgi:hypothetical protein